MREEFLLQPLPDLVKPAVTTGLRTSPDLRRKSISTPKNKITKNLVTYSSVDLYREAIQNLRTGKTPNKPWLGW